MSFFEAIQSVFTQYASFRGRARRREFWFFFLFQWIVTLLLSLLFVILGSIFSLACLIPGLAVTCRRLHDTGRSGWFMFIALIPLAGPIILLVFLCQDGNPGSNQYGENPKEGYAAYSAPAYTPPVNTPPASAPAYPSASAPAYPAARNPAGAAACSVSCTAGPLAGQVFSLSGQSLTFGRDAGCQVRFPEGTPGVSRTHCRVYMQDGAVMLEDWNSTYGTFLSSGFRLTPNQPQQLFPGSGFYLAGTENMFTVIG